MGETGNWCLIESDPGVFSELISDLGVKGVQVEELYSLDDHSLSVLGPVYGLIFLFKWVDEKDVRPTEYDYDLFFARQVITNACATQAILGVLLNHPEIDLGEELGNFKEFTREFDAETKGFAITNSNKMRSVHNSFSRAESLAFEETGRPSKTQDAFHFISYLPVNGHLYELDGLKSGPINLGPCTNEDWLSKVTPVIEARMSKYQQGSSEIRFNLMAVIKDRILSSREALEKLDSQIDVIQRKISTLEIGVHFLDPHPLPATIDELAVLKSQLLNERENHLDTIAQEERKRERFKKENLRRKHNFIPFIYNLLAVLAEKNELLPLTEKSKSQQGK